MSIIFFKLFISFQKDWFLWNGLLFEIAKSQSIPFFAL